MEKQRIKFRQKTCAIFVGKKRKVKANSLDECLLNDSLQEIQL